jgi:hypothetical protein
MPLIGVKNENNGSLQIVPVKVYLLNRIEFNMAEGKVFACRNCLFGFYSN